MQSPSFCWNSS